jgi:hypothetical protein
MVHQLGPRLDDLIARPHHLEVFLRSRRPVLHRVQQPPIGAPLPGEEFGIEAIIPVPPAFPVHLTGIGHNDVVA